MPERPILFDYTLRTADACEGRTHYELLPSGVVTMAPSTPAWAPHEPEAQTIEATLEIEHGSGGRVDVFVLAGDQHRDLEDYGLFDDFLREIGAGCSPQDALAHTLDQHVQGIPSMGKAESWPRPSVVAALARSVWGNSIPKEADTFAALLREACGALAPKSAQPSVGDDLPALRELCEQAGISLVEAQEEAIRGRWDWRDENGNASDASLDSERVAALNALNARFGDAWRLDVAKGDTRGLLDYVSAELEAAQDLPEAEAENEGGMRP